MSEQKKRISESVEYLKSRNPFQEKIDVAIITYKDPLFLKEFRIVRKVKYSDIPPALESSDMNEGDFLFAALRSNGKNVFIMNGRFNFYNGYSMRNVAHPIYVLKSLGVKTLIIIDEVGHLNPRFSVGSVALIYDHINLMADNPLIGENDSSIGPRFPDMSNAYDESLYIKAEKCMLEQKYKFHPSVYLGTAGPESETEAECRFYREIGTDVVGYSLVPENIAAVHSGLKCVAFGMISRELVADRLKEISESEKKSNLTKAEKSFSQVFASLMNSI